MIIFAYAKMKPVYAENGESTDTVWENFSQKL